LRRYAGQHLLRWHKDKVRGSMRAASCGSRAGARAIA
ncbi:hypothetical protein, partial [Pseudomonas aeruginosa]